MSAIDSVVGPTPGSTWISIREASELCGVSVATLRRWCDAGEVHAFTTRGGHRRFAREALVDIARTTAPAAGVSCRGETRTRIVRAYREVFRAAESSHDGPLRLFSQRARHELRQYGTDMIGALLEAIDGDGHERAAAIERARVGAISCAAIARQSGLALSETLELFIRLRSPFLRNLGVVVRGQERAASDATAVLVIASDAFDQLLPAVVDVYVS